MRAAKHHSLSSDDYVELTPNACQGPLQWERAFHKRTRAGTGMICTEPINKITVNYITLDLSQCDSFSGSPLLRRHSFMVLARPDLQTAKGLLAIPHGLAVIATVFRLWDRHRMRRLWWDDLWAFIALILDIPHMIMFFIRPESGSGSTIMSIDTRVAIYWISLVMFPSVVWAARISISVSILRLCQPGTIWRRLSLLNSYLFGLLWAGIIIYRTWQCGHDSAWHANPGVQCFLPRSIGIMTLVTDIVADVLLIAIPMIMMWSYQMPKSLRRLFISVFASSILTTVASVVYVTFLFGARGWGPGLGLIVAITSHLEAAVSLLVCNILVIVTFFYRLSHDGEDLETIAEVSTQDVTRVHGASVLTGDKDGSSMKKDSTSDVDLESK